MDKQPVSKRKTSTIGDLLVEGAAVLGAYTARIDCEVLLAHSLGKLRGHIYAYRDAAVDDATRDRYLGLLQRRKAGEPVAYLLGSREFWSLDIEVDTHTLVPRPETELLVELTLQHAPAGTREVLDLGTGSGAVALALAHERSGWRLCGVDIDEGALRIARRNAERLNLANLEWVSGDWFAPLGARQFDVIVANPPYVRDNDRCLDAPGLRFEPRQALVAGRDGLKALRRIVKAAPHHLRPRGHLLCEHGATQGKAVRKLFEAAGFVAVESRCDLSGRERVTMGTLA